MGGAAPPPPSLVIVSTVSLATGPLLVAAALLASAGVAKLGRPAPTGLALARAGLPGSDPVVRALGAVEVAAAAGTALLGGVVAAPLGLLYAGFAAFTAVQARAARGGGAAADCGCFGDRSAPVGATHVVVNVAATGVAAWALATGADGLLDAAGAAPGATAALTLLAVVGAVGVRALLTDLAVVRALVGSEAGA